MTSVPASIDRAVEHLRPVIEERQRKIEEYGQDYPDKPVQAFAALPGFGPHGFCRSTF